MAKIEKTLNPIVSTILNYKQEAENGKKIRMDLNKKNFDCYHLRQDYQHKQEGQSREFLGVQSIAVEQLVSGLEQGLTDVGDWFRVEKNPGVKDLLLTEHDIDLLLGRQLDELGFHKTVADSLKLGLLGSLMILKVTGKKVTKPTFFTKDEFKNPEKLSKVLYKEDNKVSKLNFVHVRQENFFPDPTMSGLYTIEEIDMDYCDLLQQAKENPDIYDIDEIKKLAASVDFSDQYEKYRETNQRPPWEFNRKRIKVDECWGNILDPVTGEIIHENCVAAVANDHFLIRPPAPNPFWHQKRPYVVTPIIRVPNSVWHKALMDAPTAHNTALNEIYNLIIDGGLMSVFGIKQIRESYLEDPSEINKGIVPGTTLKVATSAPPGAKVLEQVSTGTAPQEATNAFNITYRELLQSAVTNELKVGSLAERNVKATEIVASNNAISGMLGGIAKLLETDFIEKVLDLSWATMLQESKDWDLDEVKSLIGDEKAIALSQMEPEEIFSEFVNGHKFRVYGLSMTLNKIKDFRKLTSLLQTIFTSPVLVQEFSKVFSLPKFLMEIVKSLDINIDKISLDNKDQMTQANQPQAVQPGQPVDIESIMSQLGQSNQQSQIPQAGTGFSENPGPTPDRSGLNTGLVGG